MGNFSRRQFVKQTMLGLMTAGGLYKRGIYGQEHTAAKRNPGIKKHNILGRTGFRVSDIAFGAPENEAILSAALDAGINYLDTGEEYSNGGSERTIGRVMKDRDRKTVFINTKLRLERNVSKEEVLQRTRKCLERLNTEYIDCLMIHNATDVSIINCPGFHAASRLLKEEGRLRFLGITSHGTSWWKNDKTLMGEAMEKVCMAAAEDGRFDVFLFIYNFLNKEMGERILKVCQNKNIGTSLMKVNPIHNMSLVQEEIKKLSEAGNEERASYYKERMKESQPMIDRINEFAKKNNLTDTREIRAGAFRFVLNHPGVHTVCCGMPNFEELDTYISLSGTSYSSGDDDSLAVYEKGLGRLYCRHACGVCEPQCPLSVPVNTIMRYNHYFVAQGREKYAMEKYEKLTAPKPVDCGDCPGYCEGVCPHNVPVRTLLMLAHSRLSL